MKIQIVTSLKQAVSNINTLYKKEDKDRLESFLKDLSKLDIYTLLSANSVSKIDKIIYNDNQDIIFEFLTVFNSNLTIEGIDLGNLITIVNNNIEIVNSYSVSEELKKLTISDSVINNIDSERLYVLIYIMRLFMVEILAYTKGIKDE